MAFGLDVQMIGLLGPAVGACWVVRGAAMGVVYWAGQLLFFGGFLSVSKGLLAWGDWAPN